MLLTPLSTQHGGNMGKAFWVAACADPLANMLREEGSEDEADILESWYEAGTHVATPPFVPEPLYEEMERPFHVDQ